MLTLNLPETEFFDASKNEFFTVKAQTLVLEHSLVSLSKWEAIWKKPFLSKENKSVEETIDYIKCMTVTTNVQPIVYVSITAEMIKTVETYIEDPMTATVLFQETKKTGNKEIPTAELIYYYMIALSIPFECQKWHLNRLLMLINVCNIKNQPPKKMSRAEIMARNKALNQERKARLNTTG